MESTLAASLAVLRRCLVSTVLFCAAAFCPLAGATWTLTPVAMTGVLGIEDLRDGAVGPSGELAFFGRVNGVYGIYLVQDGTLTRISNNAEETTPELGKQTYFGTFGSYTEFRSLGFDSQGRLLFSGEFEKTGGTNVCLRWDKGTYTRMLPNDDFAHYPSTLTSDGYWLVAKIKPQVDQELPYDYYLTNGTTTTLVLSFTEGITGSSNAYETNYLRYLKALPGGRLAILKEKVSTTKDSKGLITNETMTLTLSIVGANPTDLATSTRTAKFDNTVSGLMRRTGDMIDQAAVSDDGIHAFYTTIDYSVDGAQPKEFKNLLIHDELGTRTVERPEYNIVTPLSIDNQGRVTLLRTSPYPEYLASGLDGTNDKILALTDSVNGSVVNGFNLEQAKSANDVFGDHRTFLIKYSNSTELGYLVATSGVTSKWATPSGGSWNADTNWLPAKVPEANGETLFNLDATYDVTVGSATVGRVAVEKGSVAFRAPTLSIVGPFSVGADARFTLSEGSVTADTLDIGSLPPISPEAEPLAKVFLSNTGTQLTIAKTLRIGYAAKGDLFVSGAKVQSGAAELGAGAFGSATLSGPGSFWGTGNLVVGKDHAAELAIEGRARVVSTDAYIGLGTTPGDALGIVTVDNQSGTGVEDGLGNWYITGDLTVGGNLGGRLNLKQGGFVGMRKLRTAVASSTAAFNAVLSIDGTGTQAATQTTLYAFDAVTLAEASQSNTWLDVSKGGRFATDANVTLGAGENSEAAVFVSGVNENGLRSSLEVSSDATSTLKVGGAGNGSLSVQEGARVEVSQATLGGTTANAQGEVSVSGAQGDTPSEFTVTGTLYVGGDSTQGTTGAGVLEVSNQGRVWADTIKVSAKGTVKGNGFIHANTIENNGTLSPSTPVSTPPVQPPAPAPGPVVASASTPSLLTLEGNLVCGDDSRLVFNATGAAPTALVVKGGVTLGGKIVLACSGGYAPKAGDVLHLIDATASTGAATTTEITGLAPGFGFSLASNSSGAVTLTALNDGVPTTTPSRLSNLSILTQVTPEKNLLVGFYVAGGSKSLLARAVGPGLAPFLSGYHPDPSLTFRDGEGVVQAANDSWDASLGSTMASLGAFTLPEASADAALLQSFGGLATLQAAGNGSGTMLVELYDADPNASPHLINLSVRNTVSPGSGLMIAGFVIRGDSPLPVVVRAVGPGLLPFGVTKALANPTLTVFNAAGTVVAENDDWDASLSTHFSDVGAFALTPGSKDAALSLNLAPGAYTVHVKTADETSGEALVEVYEN